MTVIDGMLVKIYKGFRNLSLKQESEDTRTVSYTITLSKSFDSEFRSLAAHLHVGRLELLRMSIVVYSFMVECVKEKPTGEWVFYDSEDAEYSEMVLESRMFLPVTK